MVALAQQHRQGQPDITRSRNCDIHLQCSYSLVKVHERQLMHKLAEDDQLQLSFHQAAPILLYEERTPINVVLALQITILNVLSRNSDVYAVRFTLTLIHATRAQDRAHRKHAIVKNYCTSTYPTIVFDDYFAFPVLERRTLHVM